MKLHPTQDSSRAADELAGWIPPWEEAAYERARKLAQKASETRRQVLEEVAAVVCEAAARPVGAHDSERAIRELARRRAALMLDRVAELAEPVTASWLAEQCAALEGGKLPPIDPAAGIPEAEQLAGLVKRATSPLWWRRALRKAAGLKREAEAIERGEIGQGRALYVTNETARRHLAQAQRNRETLARTYIETAEGDSITLAQAADASTANPAIRRGELMTRIKGCEQWAARAGMVGDFATLTTPSRFHAMLHKAKGRRAVKNPKHDPETSPREAQGWLCEQWAKVRAALARRGLRVFGFRVAEPHHDATPHWHALWWVSAEQAEEVRGVVRSYWTAEAIKRADEQRRRMVCRVCTNGRPSLSIFELSAMADAEAIEPGILAHRVKFERIKASRGGALAYVSKYIAKGIDDAGAVGVEGHDEAGAVTPEEAAAADGARRVRAWASQHGIRQFQAFGQPPVTAWRELRRLDAAKLQGEGVAGRGASIMAAALAAVNRDGERRACWRGYMEAQGGAMLARKDYRIAVEREAELREGMYGTTWAQRPIGLRAVDSPRVYRTERKEWRPRGAWGPQGVEVAELWGVARLLGWSDESRPVYAAPGAEGDEARPKAAQPRTRVNNCTQHPDARRPLGALPGSGKHAPACPQGVAGHQNEAPGGDSTPEEPPWKSIRPLPNAPRSSLTPRPMSDSCRQAFAQLWKAPPPSLPTAPQPSKT